MHSPLQLILVTQETGFPIPPVSRFFSPPLFPIRRNREIGGKHGSSFREAPRGPLGPFPDSAASGNFESGSRRGAAGRGFPGLLASGPGCRLRASKNIRPRARFFRPLTDERPGGARSETGGGSNGSFSLYTAPPSRFSKKLQRQTFLPRAGDRNFRSQSEKGGSRRGACALSVQALPLPSWQIVVTVVLSIHWQQAESPSDSDSPIPTME